MLTRFEQYLKSIIEFYATQPGRLYNLPDKAAQMIAAKLQEVLKEDN